MAYVKSYLKTTLKERGVQYPSRKMWGVGICSAAGQRGILRRSFRREVIKPQPPGKTALRADSVERDAARNRLRSDFHTRAGRMHIGSTSCLIFSPSFGRARIATVLSASDEMQYPNQAQSSTFSLSRCCHKLKQRFRMGDFWDTSGMRTLLCKNIPIRGLTGKSAAERETDSRDEAVIVLGGGCRRRMVVVAVVETEVDSKIAKHFEAQF